MTQRRHALPILIPVALITLTLLLQPISAAQPTAIPLDDFEGPQQEWKYIGGWEFPGAQGSLEPDTTTAHSGKTSLRLRADFTKGGAYVGLWKVLPAVKAYDLGEIRMWVKSDGVASIGIRILDDTGQCHQKKNVGLAQTDQWQELVLPIRDLIGFEYWAGANDGKWHGPVKEFGLNIGLDCLGTQKTGTLWIDDVSCTPIPAPAVQPTVLPCKLSHPICRPGYGTYITYRWDALPMGKDLSIFVHFRGPKGRMLLQNDHTPPTGTATWTGRVEYEKTIVLPTDAPEGKYDIILGIYDPKNGGARCNLRSSPDAPPIPNDPTAFKVGTIEVRTDAPIPVLPKPSLDLKDYRLTFDEDFTEPLSVSAWGPDTRWIAHTPYGGDFGDARFSDPEPGFPFTIKNGILRIEAGKDDSGRWRSGLLCSVDPKANGFSQKYGYFEMRAKLPKGPGTWPAFWLLSAEGLRDKSTIKIEIDVVEQYGRNPNALCTNIHLWYPDKRHTGDEKPILVAGMTDDFHTYGVKVDPDFITFYYDRSEIRRSPTPEEGKVPLYILANLALGAGWPIDQTPDPSHMYVDYIRAWALPNSN